MKTKKLHRGGWPKRERESILIRVEPALGEWLAQRSAHANRSRASLVELWLRALREVAEQIAAGTAEGQNVFSVVEDAERLLVERFVQLGVMPDFIRRKVGLGFNQGG